MNFKTFHFDLGFALNSDIVESYYLTVNGVKFPIQQHTQKSLEEASNTNQAIRLLGEKSVELVTHFSEVPAEIIADNQLTFLEVIGVERPKVGLPYLYGMYYYIPRVARENYIKRKITKRNASILHPKLSFASVETHDLNQEESISAFLDADEIVTPLDTAKSLLFQHPELANNKPFTASVVMNDHIYPPQSENPDQYNRVNELATEISRQGPATDKSGWAKIKQSETEDGELMYAEFTWEGKDGGTIYTEGDPIMIYDMSDRTAEYSGAPVSHALQTSRNDLALKNEQWVVNQGVTTNKEIINDLAIQEGRNSLRVMADSDNWTATNKTPHHGLEVYPDSISYKPEKNQLDIDVKNTFLRQLGSYVEFFEDTEMTQPIANPTINGEPWPDYYPEFLRSAFETSTKKGLGTVPNVNSILGIPMPTDPTLLEIPWPQEAQAAKLLFGGGGTSNWENHIVWPGFILTGIFQYGIPLFFMAAGAAVTSTQWYKDFVSNKDNVMAAAGIGFGVVGGGVTTAAALGNTKKVLFSFASSVAGILVKKGMEKLAAIITTKLVAAQVANAAPIVGMALRIANIALDLAQIAITTGELLSSPAVLEVDVKRKMTLKFTLKPDPKHGEPGKPETAIWPAVADNAVVIVSYTNGTSFQLTQRIPETSSSDPLEFVFNDVGWGGSFDIQANVYSSNGWIAGKYQSDEMLAVPDNSTPGVKSVEGSIVEQLVPLTQDTQYNYYQQVGYNEATGLHGWKKGTVPTATQADLSCNNVGYNLCQPVNITINQKAYQVGYSYRASGQGIPLENPDSGKDEGQMFVCQNISVLSDATMNERLKFTEIGFKVQPFIAYDMYGEGPSEDEISDLNFILDSRNGEYHLRQVKLMDGKHNFGLTDPELLSWGKFYIPNLDAMVIHPSGFLIAVSWEASKMQILRLPAQPVPDAVAPEAQIVSGKGVLQGLTNGPIAITVTPDGAILLLETLNSRIQAFDTKGNPVPSFPGPKKFDISSSIYSPELNKGEFSDSLQQIFLQHGLGWLFENETTSFIEELNTGVLTENIISAFANNGVYLTYETDQEGNIIAQGSSFITVVEANKRWKVTDPNKNFIYELIYSDGAVSVFDQLNNVEITIIGLGEKWVAADLAGGRSYLLELDDKDPAKINVMDYNSFLPLKDPIGITYLDLAVEAKGFIYVLSYKNQGDNFKDYILDIYNPDGSFLVRSPDPKMWKDPENMQYVSAARMTMDIFRNLFTLNYNTFSGPNKRTEPGVSQWTPTPPMFELDYDTFPLFKNGDMDAIRVLFADNEVILSESATIQTVNEDGEFIITDGEVSYNVIVSLNATGDLKVFVYDILS